MDFLVSVIIPVYNTEIYIDKCLSSVVNQSYKNLQIILIDDGSKEPAAKLCDEWALKDSRISVIHKDNEGLSFTRNKGLDVATGKYLCFLDSDDSLELNTIEECVKRLENSNADACFYPRKTFDTKGNYTICKNVPDKLEYTDSEVMNDFSSLYWGPLPSDTDEPFLHTSVCRGMFLRSSIEDHHLRFPSERVYLCEDVAFGLDFCKYAKKILIIPEYFYNYTYNEVSLTKSYRPQRFEQAKNLYSIMAPYLEEYKDMIDAKLRCDYRLINMIRQCIETEVKTMKIHGFSFAYNNIKKMCNDDVICNVAKEIPINSLTTKRKIFLKLLLNKQCLLLILFYMIK